MMRLKKILTGLMICYLLYHRRVCTGGHGERKEQER
jgi:hypothetical protein